MDNEERSTLSGKTVLIRAVLVLICVAVPLGVGLVAAYVTRNNMVVFDTINKPPLTPPASVFPIAWTILYVLMGLASYFVIIKSSMFQAIYTCLPYIAQLILNFMWSIIFFSAENYLTAFFCLLLMWILIAATMVSFRKVSMLAMYLLVPYFLWVTFAGYLNLSIVILNK